MWSADGNLPSSAIELPDQFSVFCFKVLPMPTNLQQWPRRRFDRALGQWIEPFNYGAAIKATLAYVFVALVFFVPIFLICLRIASTGHAADSSFAKTFLWASEEGMCPEPEGCPYDDP